MKKIEMMLGLVGFRPTKVEKKDKSSLKVSAKRLERGMTLIEIMVVVVIISLVAGVVGVSVLNRLEEARKKVAYTQIKQISEALQLFKLSFKKFPGTAEGLSTLTVPKGKEQPFMPSVPLDPWDNEYVYIFPGVKNSNSFDLMSYGPDGVDGGGDDVGNWEEQGTE